MLINDWNAMAMVLGVIVIWMACLKVFTCISLILADPAVRVLAGSATLKYAFEAALFRFTPGRRIVTLWSYWRC